MTGERAQCLQFGDLILRRCAGDVFEIISGGRALARLAVENSEFPALTVARLASEARSVNEAPQRAGARVVLKDCRDGDPDCFRLTAEHDGERLIVVLRGDSHRRAGRHHFQLFWWRAEFRLEDGNLVIIGPSLAGDSWS